MVYRRAGTPKQCYLVRLLPFSWWGDANRGTMLRVTVGALTIETQGSRRVVMLNQARFNPANLGFMTPEVRAVYDSKGLSIILANND